MWITGVPASGQGGQIAHTARHAAQPALFLLGRQNARAGGVDVGLKQSDDAGESKGRRAGAEDQPFVLDQDE
jgi:hypothetical protein